MQNIKQSSQDTLTIGKNKYTVYNLSTLEAEGLGQINQLPYSIRVLVENLLRHCDNETVNQRDIERLMQFGSAGVDGNDGREIPWFPGRVVMQDFSGLPALLDLAVLREKIMDNNPEASNDIQPAVPVDVIIDHSLQINSAGCSRALQQNMEEEFHLNSERFAFFKWAGQAFKRLRVFPPGSGIIHQVNLEYLSGGVSINDQYTHQHTGEPPELFPETCIGTDSHTTMINGMGVVGWGVGGIEAEAVILGQPNYIKIPPVVGVYIEGKLPPRATATDLALTLTQFLREQGVVESFVEFTGPGLHELSIPDRATVANMAPEYGATLGYFPVDQKVIDFLNLTGRREKAFLTEHYYKYQHMFYDTCPSIGEVPRFSRLVTFNLENVEPSVSGPSKPWDRIPLNQLVKRSIEKNPSFNNKKEISNNSIVIASITSCTNTSNPELMLAAGLVAQKAVKLGLTVPDYVKTSLIPGSRFAAGYLENAGLLEPLEKLGFHIAGYGCGTCVGNSGSLKPGVEEIIREKKLDAVSVLSGNRNFEARIHPKVRSNFLASPPLVVAFALAGTIDMDMKNEPLGFNPEGTPVFLTDVWPEREEIDRLVRDSVASGDCSLAYEDIMQGSKLWQELEVPRGNCYPWDKRSTYIRQSPFFDTHAPVNDITRARPLLVLGDAVTTDHISPVSAIPAQSPAGEYLRSKGIPVEDLNSYGARRGDHETMARGTFSNIRLKNRLAAPKEGGWTRKYPGGQIVSIYQAARSYREEGIPLIVFAGKSYGAGSARDWAAKGTMMLGVRAVIAQSFERIHRSNLVGMGVLPMQFCKGESYESLGLRGDYTFSIQGLKNISPSQYLTVHVENQQGTIARFQVLCRLDTPKEVEYYRKGGILPYCRRLLES